MNDNSDKLYAMLGCGTVVEIHRIVYRDCVPGIVSLLPE